MLLWQQRGSTVEAEQEGLYVKMETTVGQVLSWFRKST